MAKASARSVCDLAGIEVRRKRTSGPPPLHGDPLEALYLTTQLGRPAAFRCPIGATVDHGGFGFGPGRWHPFVAAARALEHHGEAAADRLLERYYAAFSPGSAAEAYLGFNDAPKSLRTLPPHLFALCPWQPAASLEEVDLHARRWLQRDNREHGRGDLTLAKDGHPNFGPVSPDKRKLELRRLATLAAALRRRGYDRAHGDCRYIMIRRGRDFRCIPQGGYHRTAIMAALGADWIPAQATCGIDVADVDYWPQVRGGLWSRRQALAYVNYLFEYNSADWARTHAAALGLDDRAEPVALDAANAL